MRVVFATQRVLSAASTPSIKSDRSRLDGLRDRLRDEESANIKLHEFSFSGNVSYGTAVPRRTRDKDGKVSRLRISRPML